MSEKGCPEQPLVSQNFWVKLDKVRTPWKVEMAQRNCMYIQYDLPGKLTPSPNIDL